MFANHRPEILHGIKRLYEIIEDLTDGGTQFSLQDVAERFRATYSPGETYGIDNRLVFRRDVARIGKSMKCYVEYIEPPQQSYSSTATNVHVPDNGATAAWLAERMNDLIARRKTGWSVSTFRNYKSAASAFSRFVSCRDADSIVDRSLLSDYRDYLVRQNLTEGTVSLYLRLLKSVAMSAGIAGNGAEIFKGLIGSYSPAETMNRHQSLDRNILRQLSDLDLSDEPQLDVVRDLFMFCFFCRGMEVTDAISLRSADISGDAVSYRKRGNGVLRTVILDAGAKSIIRKYRNTSGDYVLPIIDRYGGVLLTSIRHRLMRDLKKLGQKLTPQISLTFNMSRYSWLSLSRQLSVSSILDF